MIMAIFAMMGFSPGDLLLIIMASRRYRTEMTPRDHFDRWAHAKRRAATPNKPPRLKWLCTAGDERVPIKRIGKILAIEPWMAYYIVFVKTKRFSWSVPHLIRQDMCSDLNRRNLWVRSRGFTGSGPVRYPIPPREITNIDEWIEEHLEAFRHSFEQLMYLDITENMAWGTDNGMAPPIRERTRITEADSPSMIDKEYTPEQTRGVTP